MGIFDGKKNKDTKKPAKKDVAKKSKKTESKPVKVEPVLKGTHPGEVLLRPHLTEKALLAGRKNTYVFEVSQRADKPHIVKAIEQAYGVKPLSVNVINQKGKKTSRRMQGKQGVKKNMKKAIVRLREGDKLQLV